MADSLVLTGVKQVTKQTGTEMIRVDAKRGGNTWQLPRWWVKGNGTVYVSCTVFKVVAGGETGYLAIEASGEGVNIKITHDGSFNFAFSGMNEVSRAALYDSSMALVEHYVFPRISGGQTMVVTPPNGADRPGTGAPAETLTAVTLSGDATADDGDSVTYTAAKTGTATDVVYVLTSDVAEDTISGLEVAFDGAADHTLTLTGTSTNAGTSKTDTLTVTVSAAAAGDASSSSSSSSGSY